MNNQCPKCGSSKVNTTYPRIMCLECHYSEPMVDYPVSYDYHREMLMRFGKADPGPCEPSEQEAWSETILPVESYHLQKQTGMPRAQTISNPKKIIKTENVKPVYKNAV